MEVKGAVAPLICAAYTAEAPINLPANAASTDPPLLLSASFRLLINEPRRLASLPVEEGSVWSLCVCVCE